MWIWDESIDLSINPCEGCEDWDELNGCASKGACADMRTSVKENEMKKPWEQVITTESRFNQIVQKDSASLIADLINRVNSLEEDMEAMRKHIRVLDGIIF